MADNDKLLEEFSDMKKKAEAARTKSTELDGVIKRDEERMKKDYSCKDINEAEKKLTDMDNAIADKEDLFAEGVNNLKDKYDWGSI